MLDIAYTFACTQNLKFNPTKSKVLVVGKRTDKYKQQSLDNDKIGEDDNYKYFGVYFSRILKPSSHITKHLKKKRGQQN